MNPWEHHPSILSISILITQSWVKVRYPVLVIHIQSTQHGSLWPTSRPSTIRIEQPVSAGIQRQRSRLLLQSYHRLGHHQQWIPLDAGPRLSTRFCHRASRSCGMFGMCEQFFSDNPPPLPPSHVLLYFSWATPLSTNISNVFPTCRVP